MEALGPQIAAVRQEIVAEEQAVDADRRASLMARDEQRAALREAEASLGLANEEARQLARLRADGVISEIENSRARAEAERRKAMADAATAAIARIETDQTTRESDRRVRIQRLRGTLTGLEGDLATAGAAAKRFEYEVERRVLRAPIDGRIAEAADLRVGAVVDEGDRLAAIVPESPLRVVAQFAPASAIGRVRVGQPARVRLLGFPWAEYGSLQAQRHGRRRRTARRPRARRARRRQPACRRSRSATRFRAASRLKSNASAPHGSSSDRSAAC